MRFSSEFGFGSLGDFWHFSFHFDRQLHEHQDNRVTVSVVNKDLTFKAKAKAKDLSSEQVEGPL